MPCPSSYGCVYGYAYSHCDLKRLPPHSDPENNFRPIRAQCSTPSCCHTAQLKWEHSELQPPNAFLLSFLHAGLKRASEWLGRQGIVRRGKAWSRPVIHPAPNLGPSAIRASHI